MIFLSCACKPFFSTYVGFRFRIDLIDIMGSYHLKYYQKKTKNLAHLVTVLFAGEPCKMQLRLVFFINFSADQWKRKNTDSFVKM